MGSDSAVRLSSYPATSFNSRSRMGSDQQYGAKRLLLRVSIHAPAWGATDGRLPAKTAGAFQFTLPHGERQAVNNVKEQVLSFNSRSRMGSD